LIPKSYLHQLQDSGDEEASQKALAMGRELDPNNPIYGGTASASGSASVQTPTFDAKPKLVKVDSSSAKAKSVDFDLGGGSAKSSPSCIKLIVISEFLKSTIVVRCFS